MIEEEELLRLHDFIKDLNEEADNGAVVVVEGKRDKEALEALGYEGSIFILNSFKGMNRLAERLEHVSKAILMFDMDKKGKFLTMKVMRMLNNRADILYRRELISITKGRIRCIEELIIYARYTSNSIRHGRLYGNKVYTKDYKQCC